MHVRVHDPSVSHTVSPSFSHSPVPVIREDGVYHVIVDQAPFLKGNLLEDLTPPIIPSEEIDEPTDKKPADWDEREK